MPEALSDNSENSGEKELLKIIWTAHKESLLQYCRKKHRNIDVQIADVITSEAIEVLCRKLEDRHEIKSSHLAYLKGIVDHKVSNYLRGNKHWTSLDEQPVTGNSFRININPEDIILDKEKQEKIKWIFNQLSEECRNFYELKIQKMKSEEMAQKLGFASPEVVRVLMWRCKQKLIPIIRASGLF